MPLASLATRRLPCSTVPATGIETSPPFALIRMPSSSYEQPPAEAPAREVNVNGNAEPLAAAVMLAARVVHHPAAIDAARDSLFLADPRTTGSVASDMAVS
jgi:hypothetical protein